MVIIFLTQTTALYCSLSVSALRGRYFIFYYVSQTNVRLGQFKANLKCTHLSKEGQSPLLLNYSWLNLHEECPELLS